MRVWIARLTALFILIMTIPAQAARLEDDPFSGSKLDTCRWFEWSRGGTAKQGSGLQLQTSSATSFSQARIISQYKTTADSSMEVSLSVGAGFDAPIDPAAQMYGSFGLWADESNWTFIAIAKSGANTVIRALRGNGAASGQQFQSFPDIPIAGNAARLRVSQFGGNISLAYQAGGNWTTVATVAGFASDTYVFLQATTVGVQRQFVASFTDFQVTSGGTSYRPYVRGPQVRRSDFMNGAVVGDYINYRTWPGTTGAWSQVDPIQVMADNGMTWIAVDVTTNSSSALAAVPAGQWKTLPWSNSYWRSKEMTGQVMKEIASRGMKVYLQLYLTNDAAHYGKQNAPADWQTLSVDETAQRLKAYTQAVVADYKAQGITIGAYAIGNEIENGILNFYPATQSGGRIPVLPGVAGNDLLYLRTAVWPKEAALLKGAIEGVKASDPTAKIVLHAAGTDYYPSDVITKAFFKSMVDEGVNFDYAALSHPYATYSWNLHRYTTDCWIQRIQETTDYIASLGKKTIIAEGNYPAIDGAYPGPAMEEFPYTPAGQAGWVREMLRFGNNSENIAGFFYWYADYYPGVSQDTSIILGPQNGGLFDATQQARPAMKEFKSGNLVPATSVECFFNWAEQSYSHLFSPRASQTMIFPPYTYRYYPGSNAYLAESAGNVFYMGPMSGNSILGVGTTPHWLAAAGCS